MFHRTMVVAVVAALFLTSGCKSGNTGPGAPAQLAQSSAQPAQSSTPTTSPAQSAGVSPMPSPSAAPAPAPPTKPAASQAAAPASAAKQQPKPPAQPILLAGAPMGSVKFEHSKHPLACDTCHHASRPEKPATAPEEACTTCHTKPPQPGMKTGKQAAFHNPTATAGTCIDCHKKSGGDAPTKCLQCHKKENG